MDLLSIGIYVSGTAMLGTLSYFLLRSKKSLKTSRVVNFELECRTILDEVIAGDVMDRALLIRLHNGGGEIKAGVSKYITIVNERNKPPLPNIKKDFKKYKVDGEYLRMIGKLIENEILIEESKNLNPGFLKRRYEYDNILSTFIFKINETEHSFYFGSFSSKKELPEIVDEFPYLEARINKIRNMFKVAKDKKILF